MRKNGNAELRKPIILSHYYETIIELGFEKASIGKIAERMGIHPSLIIHYFKTKERMTVELGALIAEKYQAKGLWSELKAIDDPTVRFVQFIELLFSPELAETVDDSVYFTFYYLSFRNPEIRATFSGMFKWFRKQLIEQLTEYKALDIIRVEDIGSVADTLLVLIEGTDFHNNFVAETEGAREFAQTARGLAHSLLVVNKEVVPNL